MRGLFGRSSPGTWVLRVVAAVALAVLGLSVPTSAYPFDMVSRQTAIRLTCGVCTVNGFHMAPQAELKFCWRTATADCPVPHPGWYWVVSPTVGQHNYVDAHTGRLEYRDVGLGFSLGS
jgi:hypothetical protein